MNFPTPQYNNVKRGKLIKNITVCTSRIVIRDYINCINSFRYETNWANNNVKRGKFVKNKTVHS